MTTSNFNIRLDNDLKTRAFAVIERFGLTPTQAMRMFLTQIAETDSVPLSLDYARRQGDDTPNAATRQAIREARLERQTASRYHTVEVEEAVAAISEAGNG